jgi:hypothetical protein
MRSVLFVAATALIPVDQASGFHPLPPVRTGRPVTRMQVLPPHEAKTRSSGPSTVAIVPEDRTTPVLRAGTGAMTAERRPLLARAPVKAALLAGTSALLGRLCGTNGITAGLGLGICYWAFRSSAEEDVEEELRIKEAVETEKQLKQEYMTSAEDEYTDDSLADAFRARVASDKAGAPEEGAPASDADAGPDAADIERLNRMFGKSDD